MAKKKKARKHIPTAEEVQNRRKIMSDEEWEQRQHNERQLQLRNAKNTRFMFVRYASSALFFANLYWASLVVMAQGVTPAIAVPALNALGFLVAVLECFRILHKDTDFLEKTLYISGASVGLDLITVTVTLLLGENTFFPFFSSGLVGIAFVAACLAIKLVIVRKVLRVRDRRDKAYDRYVELLSE